MTHFACTHFVVCGHILHTVYTFGVGFVGWRVLDILLPQFGSAVWVPLHTFPVPLLLTYTPPHTFLPTPTFTAIVYTVNFILYLLVYLVLCAGSLRAAQPRPLRTHAHASPCSTYRFRTTPTTLGYRTAHAHAHAHTLLPHTHRTTLHARRIFYLHCHTHCSARTHAHCTRTTLPHCLPPATTAHRALPHRTRHTARAHRTHRTTRLLPTPVPVPAPPPPATYHYHCTTCCHTTATAYACTAHARLPT